MGVMRKPAEARAMAPVVKSAMLLNLGRALELEGCCRDIVDEGGVVEGERRGMVGLRRFERATCCRRALRVEK